MIFQQRTLCRNLINRFKKLANNNLFRMTIKYHYVQVEVIYQPLSQGNSISLYNFDEYQTLPYYENINIQL